MINIEIKKPVKQVGLNSCFISFSKYNEGFIDTLRQLPSRNFDPETKIWEVSIDRLPYLINSFKNEQINIKYSKEKCAKSSLPEDFSFKTKPFGYQKTGVEYGLEHNSFILADEQGLGKSKQAIDIAVARKQLRQVTQCLIICGVNSLKYNWLNEINIHSNESGFILGMRQQKNGKLVVKGLKERTEDIKTHKEFFLICNIESLRDEEFVKQIKKNTNINMIIFDEFHHCNTPTSAQSRGLQKLSNYEYKIAMTGTPILNSPLDSYVALKWIGVENANYSTFKNYYCVYGGFGNHEVTGYKNLNLLRQSLSSCMLRRLKEEELDLPPKIEQTEIVELGSEQLKIYNEVKDELLNNIDLIYNSPNPLTKLLRLRQATGYTGILSSTVKESAKFDRLEMMVADIVANDKKCIIFSNWTSITDPLIERLSKYKPAVITGEVSDAEREVQKKLFQNDPNCKVFIGTIGAAGTGLTLTAASYVFFLDLPWTYGNYAQAADRAHRIGTSGTVNIISLIARGTIDEKIWNLIHSKKDMSDMLVDGKANRKITKELLLELLS